MKKLFTIALVALISTTAYAQRSIDWSVDEVISPTELNSDFSSGTAIPLSIVLKNNGPDMAKIGDTVLYQMLITTTGNQIILGYPAANTTQFAFRILTKDMAKDDTLQIVQNLTSNLYFSQSTNVKYFITSILRNGGSADPITAEVAPNTTNNSTNNINFTLLNMLILYLLNYQLQFPFHLNELHKKHYLKAVLLWFFFDFQLP